MQKAAFLALAFIHQVYSLFVILNPRETNCIIKYIKENRQLSGSYYVSGQSEVENNCYILGRNNEKLWENKRQNQGTFNLGITNEGEYSLCFESTYDKLQTISFDIHDEKKKDDMISVQSIEQLNTMVHQVRRKMDIIHSNMRNSLIRRSTHLESEYPP